METFIDKKPDSKDPDAIRKFYEDRYKAGYMGSWPAEKMVRVSRLLKKIRLNPGCTILDYGCGAGVFTTLLKDCFPQSRVYGCDISELGIAKATERCPDCKFFLINNSTSGLDIEKFDLIFSHHVLEHVADPEAVIEFFDGIIKKGGTMFHILPSGNEQSYEERICRLVKNGVEAANGRFFFEDAGHLQRFTSDGLTGRLIRHGFRLKRAWFSNQYFGAMKWIIGESTEFITSLTDPGKAINPEGGKILLKHRKLLLALHNARKFNKVKHKILFRRGYFRSSLRIVINKITFSILISLLNTLSDIEWRFFRNRKNGSEMYLIYQRN